MYTYTVRKYICIYIYIHIKDLYILQYIRVRIYKRIFPFCAWRQAHKCKSKITISLRRLVKPRQTGATQASHAKRGQANAFRKPA